MGFDTLGLAAPVLEAIEESGYTTPTPIQAQAIPVILEGRDVVGASQTGTGKTAAFALPTLSKIEKLGKPQILVLEPTRELAHQVAEQFEKYGKHTGLKVGRVRRHRRSVTLSILSIIIIIFISAIIIVIITIRPTPLSGLVGAQGPGRGGVPRARGEPAGATPVDGAPVGIFDIIIVSIIAVGRNQRRPPPPHPPAAPTRRGRPVVRPVSPDRGWGGLPTPAPPAPRHVHWRAARTLPARRRDTALKLHSRAATVSNRQSIKVSLIHRVVTEGGRIIARQGRPELQHHWMSKHLGLIFVSSFITYPGVQKDRPRRPVVYGHPVISTASIPFIRRSGAQ